MTYTKGKWNYKTGRSGVTVIYADDIPLGSLYGRQDTIENAQLIASAPDLLEACEKALAYREQTHHGTDKCIALLEQAINKAKGGTK
jgi:hypothetical protein